MRAVDIITSKRDGRSLAREEIRFFVDGVTAGTLPDYQAAALLMAIVLRGMTPEETAWLTAAMTGRNGSFRAKSATFSRKPPTGRCGKRGATIAKTTIETRATMTKKVVPQRG